MTFSLRVTGAAINRRVSGLARRSRFSNSAPPNSGKSTLFNRLTGLRQKVANFPGVTVEQVREATGFELVIEGEIPDTPAPSAEEVRLIRELDPTEARKREFASP